MTVLLGSVMLGERITKYELGCLLLAFSGVYILFSEKTSSKSNTNDNIDTFYLLILFLVPIMVAFQNVLLRHMRGFH